MNSWMDIESNILWTQIDVKSVIKLIKAIMQISEKQIGSLGNSKASTIINFQ